MSNSVRSQKRQPTRLPRPWDSPGKTTGVGCHVLLQCMKVKSESEVAQSCLTLCDPMDCSPPGSSVHGIFQALLILKSEWEVGELRGDEDGHGQPWERVLGPGNCQLGNDWPLVKVVSLSVDQEGLLGGAGDVGLGQYKYSGDPWDWKERLKAGWEC